MTKVLLAFEDEDLYKVLDPVFCGEYILKKAQADAQKMVDEIKKEVAMDCIETLNGCMYSDYEDMCNVLKKTYKTGE